MSEATHNTARAEILAAADSEVATFPINTVHNIGVMIGAARRREEELQLKIIAERHKKAGKEFSLEKAEHHVMDRSNALLEMLSLVMAENLTEASIQIARALDVIDLIWDQYPEEAEDYRVKAAFRTLTRLLFSAFAVVDRSAEKAVADVVCENFGSPYTSPWIAPEDKLNDVDAGKGGAI